MKKYLANDLPINADRLKIIDVPASEKISKSLITNPMSGGAISSTLDKPLFVAMIPLFNYFKTVFDPIYSLVESSFLNISPKPTQLIPNLTTLLHICNNLNPSETTESGANTYGVYRIKNIDSNIVSFINSMINSTTEYVTTTLKTDKERYTFNKQLFKLGLL